MTADSTEDLDAPQLPTPSLAPSGSTVAGPSSKERAAAQSRKYYLANREKILDGRREYWRNNKQSISARQREYRQNNKQMLVAKQREHRQNNKSRVAAKGREYCQNNRQKIAAKQHEYYLNNKDRVIARNKRWQSSNTSGARRFRLARKLRCRISSALDGNYKATSTLQLLGCTIPELQAHLESQFLEGMTWDNHSRTGWHIDHIKPCAAFDLSDPEEQKKCFHYTNLQPLWAKDNLAKSDKYEPLAA